MDRGSKPGGGDAFAPGAADSRRMQRATSGGDGDERPASRLPVPARALDVARNAGLRIPSVAVGASITVAALRAEIERLGAEMAELEVALRQSTAEAERANHRKVLAAAQVRTLEAHLEHHSRQEMRAAYIAAAEEEMRAFMLNEQRDHQRDKLAEHARQERLLRDALAVVELAEATARDAHAATVQAEAVQAALFAGATDGPTGRLLPTDPGQTNWLPPDTTEYETTIPLGPRAARPHPAVQQSPGGTVLGRMIETDELVREGIARRLHDGPVQALANAVLMAEVCERLIAADPARAQRELNALKQLVTLALQDTRAILSDVRPMALDDLGLLAALKRYAAEVSANGNVVVTVAAPFPDRRLTRELEVGSFRVAQEAIANAVAHGYASRISVTVAFHPDALVLTVEDDGVGFDAEAALMAAARRPGAGIASMQERAEMLRGWLRVESAPGQGTRVALQLDL